MSRKQLTVGELATRLKDVPPEMQVIIYYDTCAMALAKSCGVAEGGDYDAEKPWNEDGTPNRVDAFFVSAEDEE